MVTTTGMMRPSSLDVFALKFLQKSMILTPCGPSAVPTGGAGVAFPAAIWSFTTAWTFLAIGPVYFFYFAPGPHPRRLSRLAFGSARYFATTVRSFDVPRGHPAPVAPRLWLGAVLRDDSPLSQRLCLRVRSFPPAGSPAPPASNAQRSSPSLSACSCRDSPRRPRR